MYALRQSPESPQRVELIATPAPAANLDKLARSGDLMNEVGAGTQPLAEVSARVDAIDRAPQPWGSFASMMGYVLVGLGLAPILGGGWADTLCAALFSVLVYGLVAWSGRLGAVATAWVPFSTAFVVGVLATVVELWVPRLDLAQVVLSAVAVILSGYEISPGAGELVAQHVVSGTENLVTGLVCMGKQIAGDWPGIVVADSIASIVAARPASPVGPLSVERLSPLLLVGLGLALQNSRRDLPWAALVSGLACLGAMAGSSMLDGNLANPVGTVVAVVAAHLWSRRTARPSSIALIPAIVMLVKGTIGFRGLVSTAGREMRLCTQQCLRMFVVPMTTFEAIAIGHLIVRREPRL